MSMSMEERAGSIAWAFEGAGVDGFETLASAGAAAGADSEVGAVSVVLVGLLAEASGSLKERIRPSRTKEAST
jgi:hypothetical protein